MLLILLPQRGASNDRLWAIACSNGDSDDGDNNDVSVRMNASELRQVAVRSCADRRAVFMVTAAAVAVAVAALARAPAAVDVAAVAVRAASSAGRHPSKFSPRRRYDHLTPELRKRQPLTPLFVRALLFALTELIVAAGLVRCGPLTSGRGACELVAAADRRPASGLTTQVDEADGAS